MNEKYHSYTELGFKSAAIIAGNYIPAQNQNKVKALVHQVHHNKLYHLKAIHFLFINDLT